MDSRRRTYAILIGIILLTLPCYVLGAGLLYIAPESGGDGGLETPVTPSDITAVPTNTNTPLPLPPTLTSVPTTTPGTPTASPTLPATPEQFETPTLPPTFTPTNTAAPPTLLPTFTPTFTPSPTLTPLPSATPTVTATPLPSATPTNTAVPICNVQFEGPALEGTDFVMVTGDIGTTVTIVNLTTGDTLGSAVLQDIPGHACPGFSDFSPPDNLNAPLVAGHLLQAQSSDGTTAQIVVQALPPTETPTETPTASPTP
ncbi:MAG TPA: hypothetical protein ENJ93_04980 [Chloroflexi bacterium]|nr:hypothetical protein [Chloroflexota bacterium]